MTGSFSKRHGLRRTPPPRTRIEEAPDDLRSVLLEILTEGRGHLWAYRELCRVIHRTPDSDIWSDRGARETVYRLIGELEWFEVFDLLEAHAGREDAEKVNHSFVRTGLAYEMADNLISLYEPESDELEVAGDEDRATKVLTGKFAPVATQYGRALAAIRGRPADPEKAIGEGLGALEAVVRILGKKQDFGANVDKLLGQGQPVEEGARIILEEPLRVRQPGPGRATRPVRGPRSRHGGGHHGGPDLWRRHRVPRCT